MTSDPFYDQAWDQWNEMIRYSPAPRYRRKRILQWLHQRPFESLLDVGCGNGELLAAIRREFPRARLAGADVSEAVIRRNAEACPAARFQVMNLDTEPLAESFDVVVCSEVVEHCRDPRRAVGNLGRMARRGLFLTVPCGPLFVIDRNVGHTRHFREEEIRAWLAAAGFDPIDVECWGFPFFNLYKHAINLFPSAMSDSFLSQQRYTPMQKAVALLTYFAFHLSGPFWGYQMFASGEKRGGSAG